MDGTKTITSTVVVVNHGVERADGVLLPGGFGDVPPLYWTSRS